MGERGLLTDHGMIINMDFDSVVHQCRELVDDDSQIYIDVLIGSLTPQAQEIKSTSYSAIWNKYRAFDINFSIHDANRYELARRAYPNVNFRHVV